MDVFFRKPIINMECYKLNVSGLNNILYFLKYILRRRDRRDLEKSDNK